MKELIIKGTGNSRNLKSVANFLTVYPTYEAFARALINGTLPVDILGLNAAGVQQAGDPLNKATLLKDSTAALFGLPNTAVPNDMWEFLVPVGGIIWFSSQTVPNRFLICDGSSVSRSLYSALFNVIGTKFGTGNGSTTFSLPDLRAAFVRGAGTQNGYSANFSEKQESSYILSTGDSSQTTPTTVTNYDKKAESSNRGERSGITTSLNNSYYAIRPYNIALTPIIKY